MKVVNIFTKNCQNLGDRCSSPALYFQFPFAVEMQDFKHASSQFEHTIIGGGGLFWDTNRIRAIVDKTRGLVISWGVGHNTEGGASLEWPDFMSRFALHGVRDWSGDYNWVPCASCMHHVFDQEYQIKTEIVHYEHRKHRTGISGLPTLRNTAPTLHEAIEFLASGETILTNSYHGAYWGTLLKRKVIIVNPSASRFFHFRFQPIVASACDWKSQLKGARIFEEALFTCREANTRHHEAVINLLASDRNAVR